MNIVAGVTDIEEEGNWRVHTTRQAAPVEFFGGPAALDDTRNCAVIIASTGMWLIEPCEDSSQRCPTCFNKYNGSLSLKGLCFQSMPESLFNLRGYINDKPYFHGLFGMMMHVSKAGFWTLKDAVKNETIAESSDMYGKVYPAGRTVWVMKKAMCGHARQEKITLGMSSCAQDEFLCTSGQCIAAKLRCDTVANCKDQTDEEDCDIVDLPQGYLKHVPPINFKNENLPLPINITVTIVRFVNVIDYKHTVELEIAVTVKWQDSRLTFNNLKKQSVRNALEEREMDKLWKPHFHFTNVQDGKISTIGERTEIERRSEPLPWDKNSVRMST